LLAVVGAHLQGQPLHFQLTQLGARLTASTKTSSQYRLYALSNTQPAKPGLVRTAAGTGRNIDVEVYALDRASFGHFVSEVNTPLAIGTVELCDGSWVKGFVAEPIALDESVDITELGGWRAYLATRT
jgi:allophanate hydrolase